MTSHYLLFSSLFDKNTLNQYIDLSSPTNFQTKVRVVSSNSTEISVRDEEEEDIIQVVIWIGQAIAFDMALNGGKVTDQVAEAIGPWAVAVADAFKGLSSWVQNIIKKISGFIYNDIFQLDHIQDFANDVINGGIAALVVSSILFFNILHRD